MRRFLSGPGGWYNSDHLVRVYHTRDGKAHGVLSDDRVVELDESESRHIESDDSIIPGTGHALIIGWDETQEKDIEIEDLWKIASNIIGWKIDVDFGYHMPICIWHERNPQFLVVEDLDSWIEPGESRYPDLKSAMEEALDRAQTQQERAREKKTQAE